MQIVPRVGINFRGTINCTIPETALSVLLKYASEHEDFEVSEGYVRYLSVLLSMMTSSECGGFITSERLAVFDNIVGNMMALMRIAPKTDYALCLDKDLQSFIIKNKYRFHNCGNMQLGSES